MKTLLVTGASSGIGAATATAAAAAGWQVALAARTVGALEALVDEIGPERAHAIRCDVTDYGDQLAMVDAALTRFGAIDAVFANAGRGGDPGGFSAAPVESWKSLVDTNILGVAYTLRASLDHLKSRRGHVVLTGSVAGRRHVAGSMYSVTKWAVGAIAANVREELRGSGVRVTLIEPGTVDTPFFDDPKPDGLRADDIANAVLYALSQPETVDVHELLVLPTPPVE